jgi:hypothetical protein
VALLVIPKVEFIIPKVELMADRVVTLVCQINMVITEATTRQSLQPVTAQINI